MNQPKSYLKWLLIILGVVILAALGVYVFYVKGGNVGGVFSLSSPTPTKSAAVSPSATANKTSTPSSGQTATPQSSPATSTPTPTPPAGWKTANARLWCAGPCGADFSVFVKNDWNEHQNSTAHTRVFFTSNDQCLFSGTLDTSNCYDGLIISFSDPGNANLTTRSYTLNKVYNDQPSSQYPKIYVSINKSLSASDQSIIFDSFKVSQ